MGICFPSFEDFSFFLGVGVLEHGLSASLLDTIKDDNGAMKQIFTLQNDGY